MFQLLGKLLRSSGAADRQPTPPPRERETFRPPVDQAPPGQEWPLETPLYEFQTVDAAGKRATWTMTIGDSFQGAIVFGRTGSGKTTGTAEHLSRAMLAAGFGTRLAG